MAIVRIPVTARLQFHYNDDANDLRFTGINPIVTPHGLNLVRTQLNVLQTTIVDHAFITVETELTTD